MVTPSKQHILIVEDDGFLAGIYAEKLEVAGYDVTLATNGEDGLRLAQKEQPSLVLLDLALPRVDGFEVLETLKKDAATSQIPVLIFSNLGQRDDIQRCMSLGATGYIIKAHTLPQEVVTKIKGVLANA